MSSEQSRPLRVLQVNTADVGGGAEAVSYMLHGALRRLGHQSYLAVGRLHGAPADHVLEIRHDQYRSWPARTLLGLAERLLPYQGKGWGARPLRTILTWTAGPRRDAALRRGLEDFDFPGAARLLHLVDGPLDLVHLHNLHGRYFDLRVLPRLSAQVPLMVTLHDQWLMTGHCAYSLDCERWAIGCGSCPYLDVYPPVPRDATAENWRRKSRIYEQTRLYATAPTRWLLEQAARSILQPALLGSKVIRLGVDRSVFRPGDRAAARRQLDLPLNTPIALFAAHRARSNPFKGWPTVHEAIAGVGRAVIAVCVGDQGPTERIGTAEIRYAGHQPEPETMALWYQAADLYLHGARADNSPLTVLEALACGTPVISTASGGIPELVQALEQAGTAAGGYARFGPDEATGILVEVGNSAEMADAIRLLLEDTVLRRRLGANAASDAARRFDFERYVAETQNWYLEAMEQSAPGEMARR